MHHVTGIIAALFAVVVLIFAVQNLGSVDVSFLIWSTTIPKVLLILGTYVLGVFSGWALLVLVKAWMT
ncbi:MAG: DUF1049 domain-containing protein [Planctomycetaceae bacterium]|jgi:uncharacterized integral membrane protein